MGAFEVQDTTVEVEPMFGEKLEHEDKEGKLKDECIVAYKVYDSCRRQNCLDYSQIGPARAEEDCEVGGTQIKAGEVIEPPANAVSVSMDTVSVKAIRVVDKQPSPFRAGFWDVDIKYDITYKLTFREADGKITPPVKAMNVFSIRATLFGSVSSDLAVVTDMYQGPAPIMSSAPYSWVEAKCLALASKITNGPSCKEVDVTIGLFSIIKLFRLVHLNVQSKGFCVPDECKDQGKINPCEYFGDLDFPMDIFSPPQRKEFHASQKDNHKMC
ncbi:MAG: hypothetical protein FWF81_09710 [Defluviitaleaceae bacterium]|nr:hypothetical protein [Defluviitaleaceae bacterium]